MFIDKYPSANISGSTDSVLPRFFTLGRSFSHVGAQGIRADSLSSL